MVIRFLLLFIIINFGQKDLDAFGSTQDAPPYCSVYSDLLDYDSQAALEDKIEVDASSGFDTCVGGKKQTFKFDDLLNYTNAIQSEIVNHGSKKLRSALRDELVRASFENLQSYTKIPNVEISKESIKSIKSCLGEKTDTSSDKKDLRFSYESFSTKSMKDTIKVKAYLDQLEKHEKAFLPYRREHGQYEGLITLKERRNKNKSRSKGIRVKPESVRDEAFDKTYKELEEKYERERAAIKRKIYSVASNNPVLFEFSRDWTSKGMREKEIELSDIGKTYDEAIPEKVRTAMINMNEDGLETVYSSYKNEITQAGKKLIDDDDLREDTEEELNEFVSEGMHDINELCAGDGERLHHFAPLVEKVMTNKGLDPDVSENDIMSLQASYCHLLQEEPIKQKGFVNDTAMNWTIGASIVGTGLLFTPFAPAGAWILGAATTVFVAETGSILIKEDSLSQESHLAHSLGWNTLSQLIENDEAYWKTASIEAVLSATWLKYPGQFAARFIKKGVDAKVTAAENLRALDEDSPEEMYKELMDSHQGKGNGNRTTKTTTKTDKKLAILKKRNKAHAFSTYFRDGGMKGQLLDLVKQKGESIKDVKNKLTAKLEDIKIGDAFSEEQLNLAKAKANAVTLALLTKVKIKNITPEKPLVLDLPTVKDGKLVKNSDGTSKTTFTSQQEFDEYVAALPGKIDDSLYKHYLASTDELSDGYKKTLDDLEEFTSYPEQLKKMVFDAKLATKEKDFIRKQIGGRVPSETNPITVAEPYIKDGKVIYPEVGGDRDIVFRSLDSYEAKMIEYDEIIDRVYATSKAQALNKESELTQRLIGQEKLRKKLGFVRESLGQIPKARRTYAQEQLYLKVLKAYDDPKLVSRLKEKNMLATLELRAERKELSRRYLSFATARQFGRRTDDPTPLIKRFTGQFTYVAAIGGIGKVAYDELTFDLDDALKSGDTGKVRAYFIEHMDIKRRTLFGASDEELVCASQIRGFVYDNMCLLPLLKEYLLVEYTKRKNDPSFDITTDPVAKRKTIDYMKYMLELRNFRGDGAISQLHDAYGFVASNTTAAMVLTNALWNVEGITGEEVSLAYRVITTTKQAKRDELMTKLLETSPSVAVTVQLALDSGLDESMVAYGELPIEVKNSLNELIKKAKSESDELALIEAKEIGALLVTD